MPFQEVRGKEVRRMPARTLGMALIAVTVLVAVLSVYTACVPALAGSSAGVTVRVTVRTCIRVLPDGTVRSNVPVATLTCQGTTTVVPL